MDERERCQEKVVSVTKQLRDRRKGEEKLWM